MQKLFDLIDKHADKFRVDKEPILLNYDSNTNMWDIAPYKYKDLEFKIQILEQFNTEKFSFLPQYQCEWVKE